MARRFFKKNKPLGNHSEKTREKQQVSTKKKEQVVTVKKTPSAIVPIPVSDPSSLMQFPNISRIISEQTQLTLTFLKLQEKKGRVLAITGLCLLLGSLGVYESLYVVRNGRSFFSVMQERAGIQHKLQVWESLMQKYPTYRDAYFQAALLAYQLGESDKETLYLHKTLQIDPNYIPAKQLLGSSQY